MENTHPVQIDSFVATDVETARNQRMAAEVLHELRLFEETVEPEVWQVLTTWATENQYLEERRIRPTGESPVAHLSHEILLPDMAAAVQFQTTPFLQALSLKVRGIEKLVESLPDQLVTLVGPCESCAPELTKRTSALICAAARLGGRYVGYEELCCETEAGKSEVIETNLTKCLGGGLVNARKASPPRELALRCESALHAAFARFALSPWVLKWEETEPLRLSGHPDDEADGHYWTSRSVRAVLSHDAPPADHLAWMIHLMPALEAAAQTLRRADRYTGKRLPQGIIERMTPPVDVRSSMVGQLDCLCEWMFELAEQTNAARNVVIGTIRRDHRMPDATEMDSTGTCTLSPKATN